MKKLRFYIFTSLLFLQTFSTSWALQLSVNQARYMPNEELVLTLIEDWAGEADVYVAITLPTLDDLYFFLTPPQNFMLDFVPYTQNAFASGSHELLRMPLPPGLPVGEYTVSVAAIDSLMGFFNILGETQTSFTYALEPVAPLMLGDTHFPDGAIGQNYSLDLKPQSGNPPYQFSVNSGSLPGGLTLDSNTGLIQGEPSVRGLSEFTVQVIDGQGNIGEIPGAIQVYGVLTFGAQGTYQGCDGLQMAFNAAQELDEIRIQQGTYECNGLEIPSNKQWENGIKISGGWDGSFENQSDDPAQTVLDGGAKIIVDKEICNEVGGISGLYGRCYQQKPPDNRILTVSAGPVSIETLSFQNGRDTYVGGAINGNHSTNITNCIFTNNTCYINGGAVEGASTITNSTFTNNKGFNGGAISSVDIITNSIFTNNYANFNGGAVFLADIITNSIFTNNIASDNTIPSGGAVSAANTITNCTFINNNASKNGGAVYYVDTIINSIFINNTASRGGAIYNTSKSTVVVNCSIANNSGGGFYGYGTILNTIFAQNKLDEEANDITSDGNLHVDYTRANNISGVVDYGPNNITGDPQFVDTENGDFRLLPNSPAIDIGDSSVITACSSYTDCNSDCMNLCDDINPEECQKSCCSCSEYKYPFLRDDKGNVIDLDGNPRVVGDAIDLGAFELQ
jgi:predicted outer membrane repeat protein